jgi:hypothetical protein
VLIVFLIALSVGALYVVVVWALFHLIGLFTNLFFFILLLAPGWNFVSPADNHLGWWGRVVPVSVG